MGFIADLDCQWIQNISNEIDKKQKKFKKGTSWVL